MEATREIEEAAVEGTPSSPNAGDHFCIAEERPYAQFGFGRIADVPHVVKREHTYSEHIMLIMFSSSRIMLFFVLHLYHS